MGGESIWQSSWQGLVVDTFTCESACQGLTTAFGPLINRNFRGIIGGSLSRECNGRGVKKLEASALNPRLLKEFVMATEMKNARDMLYGATGLSASNFKLFPGTSREVTAEQIAAEITRSITEIGATPLTAE